MMWRFIVHSRYLLVALGVIVAAMALLHLLQDPTRKRGKDHESSRVPTPCRSHQQDAIQEALRGLLESNKRFARVVLYENDIKKYVVVWPYPMTRSSLLVNLPRERLTEGERARARAVFSELGRPGPISPSGDYCLVTEGTRQASELALQLLDRVYQLPPEAKLVVVNDY